MAVENKQHRPNEETISERMEDDRQICEMRVWLNGHYWKSK